MRTERLKEFVDASGGVGAFASLLRVTSRIVYYWLNGTTPLTPSREDQILRLAREQGWTV